MARSTNRSAKDGDARVSAPTDRVEARDLTDPRELSLEEVLKSYEQPINEEQAWAVCYQCCSGLRMPRPPDTVTGGVYRLKDPSSILLNRDGTISLQQEPRNNGKISSELSIYRLSNLLILFSKKYFIHSESIINYFVCIAYLCSL